MEITNMKLEYDLMANEVYQELYFGDIIELESGDLFLYTSSDRYVDLENGEVLDPKKVVGKCRFANDDYVIYPKKDLQKFLKNA